MAHRFEIDKTIEVGATPEQVWQAITTGPGLDSWFMGRNEVEPREGGRTRIEHPIRWLHSSFLAGDDWEADYEAMGEGDPMYFDKLAKYLTFYLGRTGTPIDAFGPRRATTCGNASAARSASPPRRVWTRVSV